MRGRWKGKGRWLELHLPESERRIWSPYLSVRLDEEDRGSTLFARFAPYPGVWTFFMFLYGSVAFLVVFGATFAYVQWASGTPAWAMWAVWIGLPILALLHGVSWIGRRLGHDQMAQLNHELDRILAGVNEP